MLAFSFNSFSQQGVTVSISDMINHNGTLINNCGNIAFGTNSTVTVDFTINLSKPNNQVVGQSELIVYTIGNSGTRTERGKYLVQPVSFITNFTGNFSITLNSNDFNTSGGTLFAVFKSYSGIEYTTTCSYTITKVLAPDFAITPTSRNIECGSTTSYTFTTNNINNSPGSLSYEWNVGKVGKEMGFLYPGILLQQSIV